jgi:hypothetical protein
MNGKGWENWEINPRGELHHTQRNDLVFTATQLEGLHFYFQQLATERAELRRQIAELEKVLNMPAPEPARSNLLIFPRYTRQRP